MRGMNTLLMGAYDLYNPEILRLSNPDTPVKLPAGDRSPLGRPNGFFPHQRIRMIT